MFDLRVCVVELEATLMLCEIFSIKNHITIKNDLQPMNALFLQAIIFHSFLYLYNFHVRWLLFAVKRRYLAFQGEIKHLKK